MLYTAIISIIKSDSTAYSLVIADKIGNVKSLMASLKSRYQSESATAVFRMIIDLRELRIEAAGIIQSRLLIIIYRASIS